MGSWKCTAGLAKRTIVFKDPPVSFRWIQGKGLVPKKSTTPASSTEPCRRASADVSSSSPNVPNSEPIRVPSMPGQMIGGVRCRIRGKTTPSQGTQANAVHAPNRPERVRKVRISLDQAQDLRAIEFPVVDRIVIDDMG